MSVVGELTPSSPDWGTIVCDFCQRAPVARAGYVCWNCQSYIDYLEAPRCDCPHDPNLDCLCEPECEEDCPAEADAFGRWYSGGQADGMEAGQPREAPERSDGQG